MNGYYMVGVSTISYLGFGVLINTIFNKDIAYRVKIGDILLCTCFDFTKMSSSSLGRKGR